MEHKQKNTAICIFKGIAIGIISLSIKLLTALTSWAIHTTSKPLGDFQNWTIYLISLLSSLLIYSSIINVFSMHDFASANEYFELKNSISNRLKRIFGYKSYLIEAASATTFLSIAALFGAMPEIAGSFYFEEGRAPYSSGIIPFLTTLLLTIVIFAISRYESIRYWEYLKKRSNIDTLSNKAKPIIKLLICFIAYPIVIPFSPIIFFILFSIFNVIYTFAITVTIPVFILILILTIMLLWSIHILIAVSKRRKLIKGIQLLAKEKGYKLSKIENPYISLLQSEKKCTFTLNYNKRDFQCIIIGNTNYEAAICFTSEKKGYFRFRIGTPRHNITFQKSFDYFLNTEDTKILIINPTPREVLVCDETKERRLFNADRIWDFTIYEADAFIGSADRECLGRAEITKI